MEKFQVASLPLQVSMYMCVCVCVLVSQLCPTLRHHGLWPARLLCPWNSPGKNTGVGGHSLLQGDLPNPGIDPRSPALQADSLPSEPPGKPRKYPYVKVAQLCLTLCDPIDCSPPGSFVHGILQARILEWVAVPSSKGSSQLRDWTQVSCIAGRFITIWVISKDQ